MAFGAKLALAAAGGSSPFVECGSTTYGPTSVSSSDPISLVTLTKDIPVGAYFIIFVYEWDFSTGAPPSQTYAFSNDITIDNDWSLNRGDDNNGDPSDSGVYIGRATSGYTTGDELVVEAGSTGTLSFKAEAWYYEATSTNLSSSTEGGTNATPTALDFGIVGFQADNAKEGDVFIYGGVVNDHAATVANNFTFSGDANLGDIASQGTLFASRFNADNDANCWFLNYVVLGTDSISGSTISVDGIEACNYSLYCSVTHA